MSDRLRAAPGVAITVAVTCGLLGLAAILGFRSSRAPVLLLAALVGGLAVLARPALGVLAIVVAALVFPFSVSTGTEVTLNLATLLVPAVALAWLGSMLLRRQVDFVLSPVNRPLLYFLIAAMLSLGVGNALWDPAVPRSNHFALVQWAQWAVFGIAALAFWLGANLLNDRRWLEQAAWTFIWLGGTLAVLRCIPGTGGVLSRFATISTIRAPFWVLLAGLVGGQLWFNKSLSVWRRLFLWFFLGSVIWYAFVTQREAASNWMGVAATLAVLLWLRYRRLRWLMAALVLGLLIAGTLIPAVYEFAGGAGEWFLSGGSRMALINRVLAVTMRNPITGLGPASYRNYAMMEPLRYGGANWLGPQVNSHNNYVDIFAHTGLVGFGLFMWTMVAIGKTTWRASHRLSEDMWLHGYACGMAGAWVGSLVIMVLADWILPHVYNIGFAGFQAALPVWIFWGGMAGEQAQHEVP